MNSKNQIPCSMRFKLALHTITPKPVIPINYTYPLSAAIYRILARADSEYASFLHEKGYGKGFKLFCFSQINCPFRIERDRLYLLSNELSFQVAFHLPKAAESFIRGLFQSERIDIADKQSKASFTVQSVESLPDPLYNYKDNEVISMMLTPISPVVVGLPNEKGNYDFLSPDDEQFSECLAYNWREKIKSCYDEVMAQSALLIAEPILEYPPKSRLITIKADTNAETKIRGWMNFKLKVTAEKRYVELLLNTGAGVYNAQGMGGVEVIDK